MSDLTDLLTAPPPFSSFAALFSAEAHGSLPPEQFDDALWLLLGSVFSGGQPLLDVPSAVANFYASRLLEWEVGNGGFVQAIESCPEWFEAAAIGYEELGRHAAAARLRELAEAIASGVSYDDEDETGDLGADLDAMDWWATNDRLEYARRNRDSFLSLDSRL